MLSLIESDRWIFALRIKLLTTPSQVDSFLKLLKRAVINYDFIIGSYINASLRHMRMDGNCIRAFNMPDLSAMVTDKFSFILKTNILND
ncbi:hypothetical protein NS96R_09920 [Pseudomonas parafulva]|uniref:Uncharacterized protein n=1 Tax=Pseudomonas parafulva TaxID=157782 RepID=A0AAJ0PF32_9PSED|nr:hypothetical protein NS96R_09920 [Pseudomonas parafulva]